jgi:two-component system, cell cycle sensor histidine kinase and response regulator CckA
MDNRAARWRQKMESIGQLAGGIAHDFNNLLTAIGGYAELVLGELPPTLPWRADVEKIVKASERASGLTRQLLAFARRQRIAPQPINLNQLIQEMDHLLRRLIGEDIELVLQLAEDLPTVHVDPSQIEQVVLNLVVNARDAMPQGGVVRITTSSLVGAAEMGGVCAERSTGRVRMTVQDSGVGMSAAVQGHLFEPFFTTKPPGKGTGLGLATCYGIITQHGGTIAVSSSLGQGTHIQVDLPGTESVSEAVIVPRTMSLPQGTETILVVEDEEAVRTLAVRVLQACGYTVLEARHGMDALRIAEAESTGQIALLLTDVVMPQLSGPETAARLLEQRPAMQVLYMSGYSDHAAIPHGSWEAQAQILPKPFTPLQLAETVRRMLERRI